LTSTTPEKDDAVTATSKRDLYYDPFDFEIDANPHPIWRRMREEAPLYYNDKHDFFALSRFDDVERALVNWDTYRSGRGSTLEIIKANVELPPGMILFEDPPIHDIHRGLLSRVFSPKKMNALEPKVREFCARSLDPLVGSGRFDFVADLGAQMPMRTIGMLLGIPEEDQEAIRDQLDAGLRLEEGDEVRFDQGYDAGSVEDYADGSQFAEYIDWRAKNPSDDLMTELLNAEFDDETGTTVPHAPGDPPLRDAASRRRQRDDDAPHRLDRQTPCRAPRPAPGDRRGSFPHRERDRGDPPLRGAVASAGEVGHP
jgi:cytochrome P450